MIKYFLYSLTVVVGLSVGLLVTSDQSYAASIYDDAYTTTDKLLLHNTKASSNTTCGGDDLDISIDWSQYILQEEYNGFYNSSSMDETVRSSFQNAINNGSWSVSYYKTPLGGSDYHTSVNVLWVENGDLILNWEENATRLFASDYQNQDLHQVNISCSNHTYYPEGAVSHSVVSNLVTVSIKDGYSVNETNNYIFTGDPNYPTDYEGLEVQENAPEPPVDMGYIPKIFIEDITNWHVTLRDENFNTFDPVPFTCREDLTPIMFYEITTPNDSGIFIDGSISPTVKLELDLQDPDTADKTLKDWHISAWYDCFNDGTTFNDTAEVDFYTDGFGNIDRRIYEKCFVDEPPYIDFVACYNNIGTFIDTFIFDKIPMPYWEFSTNCHTLGKMGDWLNLKPSQRVICNEMPDDVVNTVTPFISVFLGLTTFTILIYAINRRQ